MDKGKVMLAIVDASARLRVARAAHDEGRLSEPKLLELAAQLRRDATYIEEAVNESKGTGNGTDEKVPA